MKLWYVSILLQGRIKAITGTVAVEDEEDIIQDDRCGLAKIKFLHEKTLFFWPSQLISAEFEIYRKKKSKEKADDPDDLDTELKEQKVKIKVKEPPLGSFESPGEIETPVKKSRRGRPKGFKVSAETCRKLSEAQRRRYQSQ